LTDNSLITLNRQFEGDKIGNWFHCRNHPNYGMSRMGKMFVLLFALKEGLKALDKALHE
jgi:hypothetical protein